MADMRFVKQNAEGSWDVLRQGDRRATVHDVTPDDVILPTGYGGEYG